MDKQGGATDGGPSTGGGGGGKTPKDMTPGFAKMSLPPDALVVGEKFLVGRTLGEGSFG